MKKTSGVPERKKSCAVVLQGGRETGIRKIKDDHGHRNVGGLKWAGGGQGSWGNRANNYPNVDNLRGCRKKRHPKGQRKLIWRHQMAKTSLSLPLKTRTTSFRENQPEIKWEEQNITG